MTTFSRFIDKSRRYVLVILMLPMLLSGCITIGGPSQPLTLDQQMAVSCRGYATTLTALALVKEDMTARQVETVDSAKIVISPLCAAAANQLDNFNTTDALGDVRKELRQMLIVQGELQ